MDTVGKWIASYLKQRDIDTLFTLTGGHIFPFLDGSLDAGVRVVDTSHEQAAAFAAEGWALRTGRPGAYVVTAGPGFLNAISGLAHASGTLSRTLCFAGASPIAEDDKGAPQELEQLRVAEVYTRYAKTVRRTDRIPQYMEAAFQHMRGPTPGPAFLEIPQDVLYKPLGADAPLGFGPRPTPRAAGDPSDIERAAAMLREAGVRFFSRHPQASEGNIVCAAGQIIRTVSPRPKSRICTRTAKHGVEPDPR